MSNRDFGLAAEIESMSSAVQYFNKMDWHNFTELY